MRNFRKSIREWLLLACIVIFASGGALRWETGKEHDQESNYCGSLQVVSICSILPTKRMVHTYPI